MPTKTCRETTHIVSYTCTTDKHTTAEAAEANANHLMMIMIEYSIFSSLLIVAVDYSPLIATTITTTTAMPPSNRYQLCTRIVDSCTLLSMIRNCKPSKHSTHQSSPSSSWKPTETHLPLPTSVLLLYKGILRLQLLVNAFTTIKKRHRREQRRQEGRPVPARYPQPI